MHKKSNLVLGAPILFSPKIHWSPETNVKLSSHTISNLICTLFTVQYIVHCTVHCTLYSTLYTVQYNVHTTVHCTLYSTLYTLDMIDIDRKLILIFFVV